MTDEANLATVREFLAALSPSELIRIVELFRMQAGLPPRPEGAAPILTSGLELRLPGNAKAVGA